MELLNLLILVALAGAAVLALASAERTVRDARRVRVRIPVRVEDPRLRR